MQRDQHILKLSENCFATTLKPDGVFGTPSFHIPAKSLMEKQLGTNIRNAQLMRIIIRHSPSICTNPSLYTKASYRVHPSRPGFPPWDPRVSKSRYQACQSYKCGAKASNIRFQNRNVGRTKNISTNKLHSNHMKTNIKTNKLFLLDTLPILLILLIKASKQANQ